MLLLGIHRYIETIFGTRISRARGHTTANDSLPTFLVSVGCDRAGSSHTNWAIQRHPTSGGCEAGFTVGAECEPDLHSRRAGRGGEYHRRAVVWPPDLDSCYWHSFNEYSKKDDRSPY